MLLAPSSGGGQCPKFAGLRPPLEGEGLKSSECKKSSGKAFWLSDLELLGEEPGEKASLLRAFWSPLSARDLALSMLLSDLA